MHKILVTNDGQLPTHKTMRSTYTKKKEPNYFKMSEVEGYCFCNGCQDYFKTSCALNRHFEHIN